MIICFRILQPFFLRSLILLGRYFWASFSLSSIEYRLSTSNWCEFFEMKQNTNRTTKKKTSKYTPQYVIWIYSEHACTRQFETFISICRWLFSACMLFTEYRLWSNWNKNRHFFFSLSFFVWFWEFGEILNGRKIKWHVYSRLTIKTQM